MEEKPAAGTGQGAGSECFSFLPALSVSQYLLLSKCHQHGGEVEGPLLPPSSLQLIDLLPRECYGVMGAKGAREPLTRNNFCSSPC